MPYFCITCALYSTNLCKSTYSVCMLLHSHLFSLIFVINSYVYDIKWITRTETPLTTFWWWEISLRIKQLALRLSSNNQLGRGYDGRIQLRLTLHTVRYTMLDLRYWLWPSTLTHMHKTHLPFSPFLTWDIKVIRHKQRTVWLNLQNQS